MVRGRDDDSRLAATGKTNQLSVTLKVGLSQVICADIWSGKQNKQFIGLTSTSTLRQWVRKMYLLFAMIQ